MIEMVEVRDGVRYQTCVDRAYPVAESVSQLTLMFSDDRLEWALPPMPFHPDMEESPEPEDVESPWWPAPEGCGSFFLFYDDGRLMTQGYRDDGLQHGLWWYFAHDGTLLEARLYALGVELERLPVKTVRQREPPL